MHPLTGRMRSIRPSRTLSHRSVGVSTRRLYGYLMRPEWTLEARRSRGRTDLLLEQPSVEPYARTWRSYAKTPYPFHPELNQQMSLVG